MKRILTRAFPSGYALIDLSPGSANRLQMALSAFTDTSRAILSVGMTVHSISIHHAAPTFFVGVKPNLQRHLEEQFIDGPYVFPAPDWIDEELERQARCESELLIPTTDDRITLTAKDFQWSGMTRGGTAIMTPFFPIALLQEIQDAR